MSATPLPSLLLNAARSAAVADGLVPPTGPRQTPNGGSSVEEQEQQKKKEAAAGLTMVAKAARKNPQAEPQFKAPNGHAQHVPSSITKPVYKNGSTNRPVSSNSEKIGTSSLPTSSTKAIHPPQTVSNMPPVQPQPSSSSSSSKPSSSSSSKSKGPLLRRGKWTSEEENYANRLIQEFKSGLLPLTDGTTLRTFLSKLLNCDPMRISKKFVGSNCIGKQVFRRRTADVNRLTPEHIERSRKELSE